MITAVRFPFGVAVTVNQRALYQPGSEGVASIEFDAGWLRFSFIDGTEKRVSPPPGTVVEHGRPQETATRDLSAQTEESMPLSAYAKDAPPETTLRGGINDGSGSDPPPARPIAGAGRKARR